MFFTGKSATTKERGEGVYIPKPQKLAVTVQVIGTSDTMSELSTQLKLMAERVLSGIAHDFQ